MPAADLPEPSAPTVVVVGAGISGLAAAHELLRRRPGLRVLVLDGAEQIGGKLRLIQLGSLTLDAGAESLLARRPEAIELATAVGLGDDLEAPRTTAAGIWSRGRVDPLPRGTLMGVPARSADAEGLLSPAEAALIDAEPGRPAEPVEGDVDVASYVAGRVGPAVVQRLVEPLLGGVYAGHADRLSLRATVPAVWAAAHAGTSLVEAARAATAAHTGSAASGESPQPVFTGIRGGVGRLPLAVRSAVEGLGGSVRTGVVVRELRARQPDGPGRWEVVTGSRADPSVLTADGVILAVPATPAARLLAGASPGAAAALARIETASMALVTAVLPGAAGRVASAGSGFLVPPVDGHLVKAVTYSSAKWPWLAAAAGDDLVVRLSIGRHGEEADLQRTDDELTALALTELEAALGATLPAPADTAVVRWGGGLPQYAVGHVALVESVRTHLAAVPALAACGGYLDGLGVPACIAAASRAALEVLADLPEPGAGGGRTMDS